MPPLVLIDHEGRVLVDHKPTTPSDDVVPNAEPTLFEMARRAAEDASTHKEVLSKRTRDTNG
jgi:hypothetical protein